MWVVNAVSFAKVIFFRIKQNEISVREGGVAASKIEITDSDIITQNIAIAAQANILESSCRNY